jgi:hypothetical protein
MFKSPIIKILKTFSKQDLKEFGLFVRSPFFNTNQSVIKLFEQIKKYHPEFDDKIQGKELLFEKTFGKIKYDDSFMRVTVFRLLELAKEFLIHRNLKRNDLLKDVILLDELNYCELYDVILRSISDLEKKTDKIKVRDDQLYFFKYRMEYFKNEVKAKDTKLITYKDALTEDLMLEQRNLNIYFFINSLKFFQFFLNQKDFVVNASGYPEFVNNVLEYLETNNEYLNVPTLKTYYLLIKLISKKDNKYFYELKDLLLLEEKDVLGYLEKFNIIAVLRNYAHSKLNEGDLSFKDSIFEITKYSIDKDILSNTESSRYISETRFMNLVWTATVSKQLDWLEEFINKFKNRIEPDKRQYVLAYSKAVLEFERGNNSNALEMLAKSGPIKNVFYKAAIKQLTLMNYYELKWFIPAAELLDAYRHFVKTDKLLPDTYILRCNTFINYFSKLLKMNDDIKSNGHEISKLISDLKSTSQTWLLRKAQELEVST